jgi:excisionase family DNA binding protein
MAENSYPIYTSYTKSDTQAETEQLRLPQMMTIREIAATGVLPEYALRTLVREGKIPAIRCGTAFRINFNTLLDMLNDTTSALYTA